jgi:hypothetical protein
MNNTSGLQAFTHLGYHVNISDKTLCCFFTSQEKVKYYGIEGLVENIKLESDLRFTNRISIFNSNEFVNLFAILNDPDMLPTNLQHLNTTNLHNLA